MSVVGGVGEAGSRDLLETYADCRSKVEISGEESRVELMEKVLLMDEEIGSLLKELRKKDSEVKVLQSELEEVKVASEAREAGLKEELEIAGNQQTVMSNLLEMVNEHADAVEEELVKRMSVVLDEDVFLDGTDPGSPADS